MDPLNATSSFSVFAPAFALWLSAILAARQPKSDRRGVWLSLAGASGSLLIGLRLWSGPRLEAPLGFSASASSVALVVLVSACLWLYFLSRLSVNPPSDPTTARPISDAAICLFGGFVLMLVLSRDLLWLFVFSELMAWSLAWNLSRASSLIGDGPSRGRGFHRVGRVGLNGIPLLALSGGCLFIATLALSSFSGGTDLSLVGGKIGELGPSPSGFVEIGSFAFVVGLSLRAVWYLRRFLRHTSMDLSTACLGVGLVLLATSAILSQWWVWIGASDPMWQSLVWGLGSLAIFWAGLSATWRYDLRAWIRSAASAQFGAYLLAIGSGAEGLLGLGFMFASSPFFLLALGVAFDAEPEGPHRRPRNDRLRAPWLYGFAILSLASLPPSSGFLSKILVGGALAAEFSSVRASGWSGLLMAAIGLGLFGLAVSALRLMSRTLVAEKRSSRQARPSLAVAVMMLVLVLSSIWPQPWLSWAARAASSFF